MLLEMLLTMAKLPTNNQFRMNTKEDKMLYLKKKEKWFKKRWRDKQEEKQENREESKKNLKN